MGPRVTPEWESNAIRAPHKIPRSLMCEADLPGFVSSHGRLTAALQVVFLKFVNSILCLKPDTNQR